MTYFSVCQPASLADRSLSYWENTYMAFFVTILFFADRFFTDQTAVAHMFLFVRTNMIVKLSIVFFLLLYITSRKSTGNRIKGVNGKINRFKVYLDSYDSIYSPGINRFLLKLLVDDPPGSG